MRSLKSLALATLLVAGGASLAMAQNGPPTGGEPPIAGGAAGNPAAPGPSDLPAISPTQYAPGQYYNFYQGPATGNATRCQSRFRSYNAATGMYRGLDGRMHACS